MDTTGAKTCMKCGQTKPLDAFYRHKQMADGHLNKCAECTKADVRKNYRSNVEHYRAYEALRAKDPKRKSFQNANQRRARSANPEKATARNAVSNGIRDGKVLPDPCSECGATPAEAHHHDYSKPLEVTWLCFSCHRKAHGQQPKGFAA